MDIITFCIFLALSLILIGMGLFRPEHTELSLIGFVLLFLLSMLVLNNSLTHVVGTETNYTFNYSNTTIYNTTLLTASYEDVTDIYGPVNFDGVLNHTIGYWMAIMSIIGFVGVLFSLKRAW